MSFYNQFEQFDPKDGQVPWHPFSMLPHIASRARSILRTRSRQEITFAAQMIDEVIDQFFESEEQQFIDEQLQNNGWACKYIDEQAPDGHSGLRELIRSGLPDTANEDDYFQFPNKENTTELEALKTCIDSYDFEDENFKDGQPMELFAVLALWYVGDCLKWVQRKPEPVGALTQLAESEKGLRRMFSDPAINLSLAGKDALMAMEAVCYAEQLRSLARQDERMVKLHTELRQHRHQVDVLAEQKAAQHRSDAAKKAAMKSHEEHAQIREYTIKYFEENESEFKSAEAAATAIAGKVVNVSHRTVADWIRAHKKQRSAS